MEKSTYKKTLKLMGCPFELTVVAENPDWADGMIEVGVSEIRRIERLLTTFNDESETAYINAHAGLMPVTVSAEVFHLIDRALRISALTQGAFDITYGSIDKSLWNFDLTMKTLPDPASAKKLVRLIDYRKIEMDPSEKTVFLKEKGMRIGFGGIGKGYAAEQAKAVMRANGVENGVVNASGDLTAWGHQPDGRPWSVGIVDPNDTARVFSWLNVTDMAIATSGNYEKYIMIDGRRYSHTINPKTGLPVSGIKSVTILCPNAEIADAMATPVMIMGVAAGLDMIDQIPQVEAILIDDDNKLHTSKHIHLHCK
jgi:thiamine biosynthesis lipoprotein